ncbi:hypothetical protein ACFVZD_43340 [Streptomyces sp. NPDC058287]|uniref:hypothetical protein n=1 Tax=unclassified Streptomyces TaxID=2593676 RepID=UPI0036E2807C
MLAALDQRIAIRYNMPPMTGEETPSRLSHHLALAGRSDTLFTDDAITLIHATTRLPPARNSPAALGTKRPQPPAVQRAWPRAEFARHDAMALKRCESAACGLDTNNLCGIGLVIDEFHA